MPNLSPTIGMRIREMLPGLIQPAGTNEPSSADRFLSESKHRDCCRPYFKTEKRMTDKVTSTCTLSTVTSYVLMAMKPKKNHSYDDSDVE